MHADPGSDRVRAGMNCGIESDGCGRARSSCGPSCTAPATCGGGGTRSVCGGNAGCTPVKVCTAGMNCGAVADGCGGLVSCAPDGGTCAAGTVCGGGGKPNVCGATNVLPDGGVVDGGLNVCTPIPQATACAGKNCGVAANGCGSIVLVRRLRAPRRRRAAAAVRRAYAAATPDALPSRSAPRR